jgi:hypothetical protein
MFDGSRHPFLWRDERPLCRTMFDAVMPTRMSRLADGTGIVATRSENESDVALIQEVNLIDGMPRCDMVCLRADGKNRPSNGRDRDWPPRRDIDLPRDRRRYSECMRVASVFQAIKSFACLPNGTVLQAISLTLSPGHVL